MKALGIGWARVKAFVSRHKNKILGIGAILVGGYFLKCYFYDENCITLSQFLGMVEGGEIKEVIVEGNTAYFRSSISDWYYSSISGFPKAALFELLQGSHTPFYCVEETSINAIATLGLMGITAGACLYQLRSLTETAWSKKINPRVEVTTFEDFYGSEPLKNKLREIIRFLKDPSEYKALGIRLRKGVLLYGPPGTGKTMLARALANEANVPFMSICASEFEEIYIGVGAKRIRDLFSKAKEQSEGCIIFIDELDALGSRRQGLVATRQTSMTINQLLTELDGFEGHDRIVVVAATNKLELLDQALIRPGRFDIKYLIQLPNRDGRAGILESLLRKKGINSNLTEESREQFLNNTNGYSGAQIQNTINQALYIMFSNKSKILYGEHLLQALSVENLSLEPHLQSWAQYS